VIVHKTKCFIVDLNRITFLQTPEFVESLIENYIEFLCVQQGEYDQTDFELHGISHSQIELRSRMLLITLTLIWKKAK
jgi:hypothetical protein